MNTRSELRRLRYVASVFASDHATAAQLAPEIGALVAALDGALADDGRAVAFAAAALLFAGCAGMREVSFKALDHEISAALRAVGGRA